MATFSVTFSAAQEAMIERYLRHAAAIPTQLSPYAPAAESIQAFVDAAIDMQLRIVSHWDAKRS